MLVIVSCIWHVNLLESPAPLPEWLEALSDSKNPNLKHDATMKHKRTPHANAHNCAHGSLIAAFLPLLLLLGLMLQSANAAVTIFSDDFESYSPAAANLDDPLDADPPVPNGRLIDDDPVGGIAGTGVQLINWQAHSGSQALLVRANAEAQIHFPNVRSGSRYTLDFWIYPVKGSGDRNFYLILRGEGSDFNGDDYLAYRSDRGASPAIFYYDGVGPGTAAWVNTGATHPEGAWQHHRMVIDPNALTFDLYLDNLDTPVLDDIELSRCEVALPTLLRVLHEGNSADDGYFIIDDVSLTVEDARDLSTTFTEDFESYPAASPTDEDADPKGPWVTTEVNGTGSGKERAPARVQVVDSTVVEPRSGSKCVKLEGGQRAGISLAWGTPPQSDVEITWWARVPASVDGAVANYLRMSLYGAEDGNCLGGDNALLGYGSRDATIGDETSLTYYTTAWVDTSIDYTPDTWEEYRLTTHTKQGLYSIVKNPSGGSPQTVVDRAPFIGTATNWFPVFMAAWSSSNGSGHPPVYIDDIEIRSLDSNPEPLPQPYSIAFHTSRFSKSTILKIGGLVGDIAIDPRDNTTILFTIDVGSGAIYRADKIASGNWHVDPQPIVTGLDRPSGLGIEPNGTLWWTHDYNNNHVQGVVRLKPPWASNSPEIIVADFGDASAGAIDDDAIDIAVAQDTFEGAIGKPGIIVIADRGSDGDANNAVYYLDPATTDMSQVGYAKYLVNPDPNLIGSGNLNAICAVPGSREVVTLSTDGVLSAIDADGAVRNIWPVTLWSDPVNMPAPNAVALAVDPTTGRIWVADDTLDEIWSIDPVTASDQKELSLPLRDPSRADQAIDVHDPGMAFSPDGKFLVLSDSSVANGGGRLIIFHNEAVAFEVSVTERTPTSLTLAWQGTAFRYRVQRSSDPANPSAFVDISEDLYTTSFTDNAPPATQALYRVVAFQ